MLPVQGMVAMGAVLVKEGDTIVAVLNVGSEQPGDLDRQASPQLPLASV